MAVKKFISRKDLFPLYIGVFLLALMMFISIFPTVFTSYLPKDMFTPWLAPCKMHLLGTNDMGYDIYTELIYATKPTFVVGLFASLISLFIGVCMGWLSALAKGIVGEVLSVINGVFLMLPLLPTAIVMTAFFGTNQINIIAIISLLGWSTTCKVVKARTAEILQSPMQSYLVAMGYGKVHIAVYHILPNIKNIVFAKLAGLFAWAILTEASLSFFGLSNLAEITFGGMMNMAFRRGGLFNNAINWFLFPGLFIGLMVFGLYLVGYYFEKKEQTVYGMTEN